MFDPRNATRFTVFALKRYQEEDRQSVWPDEDQKKTDNQCDQMSE